MKPKLIELVKQLRESMKRQDEYLEALPREFQEMLFDNAYCSYFEIQRDQMLQVLFGNEMYEDINWFLFEFTPGKSPGPHIIVDGKEYVLNSDEDYYRYLLEQAE